MPQRRTGVDTDADDHRTEPPGSGARGGALAGRGGARPASDGPVKASFARTSRGGTSAGSRSSHGPRSKTRTKPTSSTSSAKRRGAEAEDGVPPTAAVGSDMDSDEDEGDMADRVSPGATPRPLRPISPELGIPALLAAAADERPRSSSLSALSSRASSPAPENHNVDPAHPNGQNGLPTTASSPSSATTEQASANAVRVQGSEAVEDLPSTPMRGKPPDLNPHDSLSELDSSDDGEPLAMRRSAVAPASASGSISTNSTPAPAGAEGDDLHSPASKRRGRASAPKSRQPRHSAPAGKAQRSSLAGRPGPKASPGRVSSSESITPTSAPARATRANVTLPPGYIWGVTSSRWPRKTKKEEEEEREEGDAQEEEVDELESDDDVEMKKENETPAAPDAIPETIETNGESAVEEAPSAPEVPEVEVAQPTPSTGDEALSEAPIQDVADSQAAAILNGMDPLAAHADVAQSEIMSREASRDGSVDSTPVATTPKGKGKAKGKRTKKPLPEPVERAKRRRLEGLDKETLEKMAARETARMNFLSELEQELLLVEQHTHPLLDFTYTRLQEEKEQKLAQLRRYQEERERELARSLEAARRASWRNWADRKDRLRMDQYLENHRSLKSLLDEEKVFPFFRDHPLFVNHHDLPPTGWYRGPQRDPAFAPRSLVHAGHYVEPPPSNPALGHDVWSLGADEIEADLALFYGIEDPEQAERQAAAQAPDAPAVPPFPNMGLHGYQPPAPLYFDSRLPGPPSYPQTSALAYPDYPPPPVFPYGFGPPMQGAFPPQATLGQVFSQSYPAPPLGMPYGSPGTYGGAPPNASAGSSAGAAVAPVSAPKAASKPPSRPRSPSPPRPGPKPGREQAPRSQAGLPGVPSTTDATSARFPPASNASLVSPSESPRQPQPPKTLIPPGERLNGHSAPAHHHPSPSFTGRVPQEGPPTSYASPATARTQPSLAAPVWPAYNRDTAGPQRSANAASPPLAFSTQASAASAPQAGAAHRVPAPPVLPAPPASSGPAKSWSPFARSPHTNAPLPPIRQTLFPTAFPTGGLPPVSRPSPLTPTVSTESPARQAGSPPLAPPTAQQHSPPQQRPLFPSMNSSKQHEPLPLPSWLRPHGYDPAHGAGSPSPAAGPHGSRSPGSTSLPGPKLPHELRAAAAGASGEANGASNGAGYSNGGGGSLMGGVGAGAGVRRPPW